MKNKVSNEEKCAILLDSGYPKVVVDSLTDKELDRSYKAVCRIVSTAKKVAIRKATRKAAKKTRETFGVVSPIRRAVDVIKDAYDESVVEINEEQYKERKAVALELVEIKSF